MPAIHRRPRPNGTAPRHRARSRPFPGPSRRPPNAGLSARDANAASQTLFTLPGVLVHGYEPVPEWNLPGGTLEAGETAEEALQREVAEEACARIVACRYLGCQEIVGERPRPHYQTRFWARVTLDAWLRRFEIVARRLVRPDEFLTTLAWGDAPTAPELLRLALAVEGRPRTLNQIAG